MFKEFKEFISRGNVIDMAVGLVTGSAFTSIVSSMVNDVIMPFIGFIMGGVNFTQLKIVLKAAVPATETTAEVAEVAIKYGNFIQAVVNFLIVAFVVFLVVKAMNTMRAMADKMKAKEEEAAAEEPAEEAPAEPAEDVKLLMEIRDLLAKEK